MALKKDAEEVFKKHKLDFHSLKSLGQLLQEQKNKVDSKENIMIKTELQSLNMLARKFSKESELASYVLGTTCKMIKDIKEACKNGKYDFSNSSVCTCNCDTDSDNNN